MGKIITFYNHKGGVGKTTLVHNIGFALADLGKKVLLIDADPQMNLTSAMYGLSTAVEYSFSDDKSKWSEYLNKYLSFKEYLNHYLIGETIEKKFFSKSNEVIQGDLLAEPKNFPKVDLISGDISLSALESRLYNVITSRNELNRDIPYKFEQAIRSKIKEYDFILIDTSPSASSIINALCVMSSDYFIAPVSPTFFSLQAIDNLSEVITNWIELLAPYQATQGRKGISFTPQFLGIVVQFAKRFKGGAIKTDYSAATEEWIIELNKSAKRFLDFARVRGLTVAEKDFKILFQKSSPFIIEKCCDYTQQLRTISEKEGIPIIYLTQEICKKHKKSVDIQKEASQYARSFSSINESYRYIAEGLTKLS